jgi:hypothetical protein
MKTTLESVTTNGKLDPEKMMPIIIARENKIAELKDGYVRTYYWWLYKF